MLECLCVCAVDLFIFISGFFSWKASTINAWKILKLLMEVIVINIFFGIPGNLKNQFFSFRIGWLIPVNYFVIFYSALMLLSPYINRMVEKTEKRRLLLLLAVFLFSVYPTVIDFGNDVLAYMGKNEISDISTITRIGSLDGYTIIQFILMYMAGCIYHYDEMEIGKRVKGKRHILVAVLLLNLVLIFGWTKLSISQTDHIIGTSLSYCSPLVILEAVLLFTLFRGIRLQGTFINKMAKASFTVYLVHGHFIKLFVSKAPYGNTPVFILYVMAGCIMIYVISSIIYVFFHHTIDRIISYLETKLPFMIET